MVGTARRNWNLTVVAQRERKWLAFVAPHGSFDVRGSDARVAEAITVEEVARIDGEVPLTTIRVRRGASSLVRECEAVVSEVVPAVDAMLAELDSTRRIFALTPYQEDMSTYLVISPDQRRRLVAREIAGICATCEVDGE